MPTHHLTAASPCELAAGVLSVLAGADPESTAVNRALDPAVLDEAVQVYQAAGLAALERRAEHDWYQVRVQFPDWSTAEAVGARQLGPSLDRLQTSGAIDGWWFLRKHPCWRLRLHGADTAAVDHMLDEQAEAGAVARWWPTVYEPEITAFGGQAGIDAAHNLFCSAPIPAACSTTCATTPPASAAANCPSCCSAASCAPPDSNRPGCSGACDRWLAGGGDASGPPPRGLDASLSPRGHRMIPCVRTGSNFVPVVTIGAPRSFGRSGVDRVEGVQVVPQLPDPRKQVPERPAHQVHPRQLLDRSDRPLFGELLTESKCYFADPLLDPAPAHHQGQYTF
jgi:hypothetical protein